MAIEWSQAFKRCGRFGSKSLVVLFAAWMWSCSGPREPREPFIVIAHAGGIAQARTYSNSLEALDDSVARGFTRVELDFSWTSDDRIVLLHDWDHEFTRLFDHEPGKLPLAEFRALTSRFGLTHMALENLGQWMDRSRDVRVITDFKERNIEGLSRVVDRIPEHRSRFVPQIHYPEEYEMVRNLGFDEIILTLYVSRLTDDAVVRFASNHDLTAVTMPISRTQDSDLVSRLSEIGVGVFVHPVNDLAVANALRDAGVDGIYTDWLSPASFRTARSLPH